MRNKFKLKGEKIFIKNDLSWEERKIQDKINRWAKTERKRAGGKGRIRKSKNEGGMENMGRDRKGEVNRKERKKYRSERKVEQRRGKIKFCVNQEGDMTEKGG